MIDLGLLAQINRAIAAKPRKHVTPAILLAIAMQESHQLPYFIDTKPGSQFAMNLHTASRITGINAKTLTDFVRIEPIEGGWKVPACMVGKLAKFRCEPGYWKRYTDLAPLDRFVYSCSWGIFQFMGPNIAKNHTPKDIEFIKRFAADVPMQCVYAAGMVDDLLDHGSVDAMYRAYNSGDPHCKNPEVVARARAVSQSAIEIQKYLDKQGRA